MDYTEVSQQLKDYFCNLLIAEYRTSEKNRQMIALLFDLVFCGETLLKIKDECLNVEKSVGKQLDIIGEWVGVDRNYDNSVIWDRSYFSFIDWQNMPNPLYQGGLSNYKNFEYLDGFTMTWKHLQDLKKASYQLGDNYFRQLIKLKIIKNSIKFTKKNIDDAIYTWSGGQVYTTWNTMQITYNHNLQSSMLIGLAKVKKCLPCPLGCELVTNLI